MTWASINKLVGWITHHLSHTALIVVKKGTKKLTAFERMNLISEDNEHGDWNSGAQQLNVIGRLALPTPPMANPLMNGR